MSWGIPDRRVKTNKTDFFVFTEENKYEKNSTEYSFTFCLIGTFVADECDGFVTYRMGVCPTGQPTGQNDDSLCFRYTTGPCLFDNY